MRHLTAPPLTLTSSSSLLMLSSSPSGSCMSSVTRCWSKKVVQNFQTMAKRNQSSFYLKSNSFYSSLENCQYLGHFCYKICSQELSKIAQSGHTVRELKLVVGSTRGRIFRSGSRKLFEDENERSK